MKLSAQKSKKAAEEARKQARVEYAELVDIEVIKAVEELESLSQQIKATKEKVYNDFSAVLDMKSEVIGLPKDNQRSHTFTTSDSKFRIMLGVNTIDGYRDTVEERYCNGQELHREFGKGRDHQSSRLRSPQTFGT